MDYVNLIHTLFFRCAKTMNVQVFRLKFTVTLSAFSLEDSEFDGE